MVQNKTNVEINLIMKSSKDYYLFEVICDDEKMITEAIYIYNQTYSTNFKLIEYIYDEVNFAKIGGNIHLSDIFSLGSMYARMTRNN